MSDLGFNYIDCCLKKLTQNKKSSLDLADAVSRVKKAFDTNDLFNLEIYRSLFHKYPKVVKEAMKREGILYIDKVLSYGQKMVQPKGDG